MMNHVTKYLRALLKGQLADFFGTGLVRKHLCDMTDKVVAETLSNVAIKIILSDNIEEVGELW
jgi:hypothetical protein